MGNVIQARDLRGARDERLVDAVPLASPWTLFLEPTNACNYRCAYCPTGHTELLKRVGRKPTLMEWPLFLKLIADMQKFPRRLKMLNLYKDGEPLLHPRFCDMVRVLSVMNVSEKIWTKTNGHLLKPELNEQLVNCGLDMIGVSVQAVSAEGFQRIAGVKVDYERYRANVLDLFAQSRGTATRVSVKIADTGLSEGDCQKFLDDFGDRCDFIAIEGLHGWASSEQFDFKLGTNQSFDGTPRTTKQACPLPLYMLTVSANGDLSVCNDDWMHAHGLGNAQDVGLMEAWSGEQFRQFRLMHLQGRRRENPACADCDYLQALPDSIDNDREELAKRYA